jgi:glycosyltransferase involved in cell wall biosynthesis
VLVFLAYYHPAFRAGGPLRTLRNLVDALGDEVDFRIVTRDRDLGDREPFAEEPSDRWVERDGAKVLYGSAAQTSFRAVSTTIRTVDPDIVYLNSFFDLRFSILPLMVRCLGRCHQRIVWLIAPRGEFSAGALAIKRWKKRPFLLLARAIGLHRGLVWQASSVFEEGDIRRVMGSVAGTVRVAPDLTAAVRPLPAAVAPAATGPLRVCFLSRISPKKNLHFAIDVVKRLGRPVVFDIFGPIENLAYWKTCEASIASAPPDCTISWRGEIEHAEVRGAIGGYDLLLFPTQGENFGHVVFEALSVGVPVLVSDRTPWHDLDRRGSGWVRPLENPARFVDVLKEVASAAAPTREARRRAAHAHAVEVAESREALEANRRLFADGWHGLPGSPG